MKAWQNCKGNSKEDTKESVLNKYFGNSYTFAKPKPKTKKKTTENEESTQKTLYFPQNFIKYIIGLDEKNQTYSSPIK